MECRTAIQESNVTSEQQSNTLAHCLKIANTMSLVDYPLFSWVVVIHSVHVSSFREAHHQEIIFPVQSASGIVYNLCCNPPVLLRRKNDLLMMSFPKARNM